MPELLGGGRGILIDDRCTFDEHVFVAHNAHIHNSHIGNHTSVGRYDEIRDANIGKYCSFSWDVVIGAPTHPFHTITNCALTYRREFGVVDFDANFPQDRTTIGNDVWIGCDVSIIAGVTIGDGAIIGAGAVVTTDIPPYEIWGGVPARKIKSRFERDVVEILEKIKWWDWSTEKIKSMLDLFESDLDIDVANEIYRRHMEYID